MNFHHLFLILSLVSVFAHASFFEFWRKFTYEQKESDSESEGSESSKNIEEQEKALGQDSESLIPHDTCLRPEHCGSLYSAGYVHDVYYSGLRRVTRQAQSEQCRRSIEFEYMKHLRAIAEESPFPFENVLFRTQCPATEHDVPNPVVRQGYLTLGEDPKGYTPPSRHILPAQTPSPSSAAAAGNDSTSHSGSNYNSSRGGSSSSDEVRVSLDPEELRILYVMLVHDHPRFAVRILDALDEAFPAQQLEGTPITPSSSSSGSSSSRSRSRRHDFVLHVDLKAPQVLETLRDVLRGRPNVYFLPEERRLNLSWGGFGIVNATLQCLSFAALDLQLPFDYFVDLSGTTYPLKSNRFIRETLAGAPNTFFMETYHVPARPEAHMWHQFVECDGALHRVSRLPLVKGINMYLSSQWFAVPRHFALWLLSAALPRDYIHYAQYIIVADENYFSTMFYNSPYCQDEVRMTLLYQVFDKWEHERNDSTRPRDPRKCLGVGNDTCGRSPSTLTMEYKYLLASSRALFARKFDPQSDVSLQLVDYLDHMRGTHSPPGEYSEETEHWDHNRDDRGKQVMLRAGLQHMQQHTSILAPAFGPGARFEAQGLSSATSREVAQARAIADGGIEEVLEDATPAREMMEGQCLTLVESGQAHFMAMRPCNPASPAQWFEIGRCTSGYEVEVEEGRCPTIRRIAAPESLHAHRHEQGYGGAVEFNTKDEAGSTKKAKGKDRESKIGVSQPVEEDSADVFCSIYSSPVGHEGQGQKQGQGKELCMDISGENPRPGTVVIGYECTGKWNQLFRLGENCTLSAVQPAIIGRVRGYAEGQAVTVCLDHSQHADGMLTANDCAHITNRSRIIADSTLRRSQLPLDDEDSEDNNADDTTFSALLRSQTRAQEEAVAAAEAEAEAVRAAAMFAHAQQFEFVPRHRPQQHYPDTHTGRNQL